MADRDPPASDAPLDEWRAWSLAQGTGQLDPARLRDHARRLRESGSPFGLREPGHQGAAPELVDVLTVDPGHLTPLERAQLVTYLTETGHRAAAGTAGRGHPVVMMLAALVVALEPDGGQVGVPTDRRDKPARVLLFQVLQAAHTRARGEALAVEPALRRVLAGVEVWAFGEAGWQPEQLPEWREELGPLHRLR